MSNANKSATIHLGDCMEVMKTIPEGSVDLIVTSPPYDAGKEYEGQRNLERYTQFAREWISLVPRLLKPGGSFWLNVGYTKLGGNETLPLTYLYHEVRPDCLRLVQELVWEYPSGMAYRKRFAHRSERWQWWALNPDAVYFDLDAVREPQTSKDKRNNPLGKNPTDVWRFNHVIKGTAASAEATTHPCAFPEAMVQRVIKACSPQGGTVLDPFMGSGTTGKVALQLGRKFIGIEREPSYLEISKTRIAPLLEAAP